MKVCLLLLLFALSSQKTIAQTTSLNGIIDSAAKQKIRLICTPNRANTLVQQPLYVIKSHNKELKFTPQKLSALNPQQIKTLEVLKDQIVTKKYGKAAQYGVIIITLDDEKYPDAYKTIQTDSVKKKN